MQARLAEAEEEKAILSTATQDELANLFGQPRTEREWRLQRIVQKDHDAKERGAELIPNELQAVKYAQLQAELAGQQQANKLNPLKFNLAQQQFAEQQLVHDFSFMNQQAQRNQAAAALEAEERHRAATLRNSGFDRNLSAARFEHDVERRGLTNMLAMERMLRENANAADTQQHRLYQDAAEAAASGAIGAGDVGNLFPGLTPQRQAVAGGYAREYARQQGDAYGDENATRAMMAEDFNARLDANPTDMSYVLKQFTDDRDLHGRIQWNPNTRRFVPLLRNPAQPQSGFASMIANTYGGAAPAAPVPQPQTNQNDGNWRADGILWGMENGNPVPLGPSPENQGQPRSSIRNGTRFIANGVVWEMRNGQRVALGPAR